MSDEDESSSHATRNLASFVRHDGFKVWRTGLVRNRRCFGALKAPTSTNGSEYPVKSAPLRPLHETITTWTCVGGGGWFVDASCASVRYVCGSFSGVSPLALSSKES